MSFLASTIIFTISSTIYFGVSIYTCYTEGLSVYNLGNIFGNLLYVLAYIVYAIAEYKAKRKLRNRFNNKSDEEKLSLLANPQIRQIQHL